MVFSLDGYYKFCTFEKGIRSLLQICFSFKNIRQILESNFVPEIFRTF